MRVRYLMAVALTATIALVMTTNVFAWYRGGYHYSYHYGGYGGYGRYNAYTGGVYHGGVAGYNAYTGRYGASRSVYNPYTGRYGNVQAAYNPYTNRYAYHYSYGR